MLYLKIAQKLKDEILEGSFKNNKKLPSELDLAKAYGTSKMTMRKSLQVLVDSGIIYPLPKIGYHINSYEQIKKFNSLSGNSLAYLNPGRTIKTVVIDYELVPSTRQLNHIFNKNLTTLVLIQRIRYVDQVIATFETIYLDYNLFPDFNLGVAENSIYAYIKDKGFKIAFNLKTVKANFATEAFINKLPQYEAVPLLEIENIGYLSTGEIFEYSVSNNINSDFSIITKMNNILQI